MKNLIISVSKIALFASLLFEMSALRASSQGLGRINPNAGLFPDSSIQDFSYLQDRPAGKHGFLQTSPEGKFVWSNGKRARFWGINVSNRSIFVTHAQIDRVVDVFARAGVNMVRFEAVDSTGGILDSDDPNSSRTLDKKKLDTLDYWVSKVKERGIYYYFDLIDFRVFKSGDGVPGYDQVGRAAKPYAFFDRQMIELQKEYARELLTHKNAYTGLKYIDDPALALLEICNEHGLFFKANNFDTLVEPYGTALRQLWNRWLLDRYGSREAIETAWGKLSETNVLTVAEDPGVYGVNLPLFSPPPAREPALDNLVVDVRRANTRLSDGVRFMYEVQRAYFREMKTALREMGLKIPITGVVSSEFPPDLASVSAELDFTSENYYADHPTFDGKDWEGEYFYNDLNPMRAGTPYQVAPWLASLRWDNKPVVVREWADVWPNRYRAISIPEMVANCAMQDFDAVLLFGYSITKDPEKLNDFNHQCDPVVWGMFGLGAQAFLRGDVKASPSTATILHTSESLYKWPNGITNLYRLAWFVRLNSTFENRRESERKSSTSTVSLRDKRIVPETKNLAPVNFTISPNDPSIVGSILDQLHNVGVPVYGRMLETGIMSSCTGEIVRNTTAGFMTINTPRTIAICGELPVSKAIIIGAMTFYSRSPLGAIMVTSLDGQPLKTSKRYIVKMVSRAENTEQELEATPLNAPGRFRVKNWGKSPVLTFGVPDGITVFRLNKVPVLSLTQTDGSWELLVNNGKATFVTDTTNVRGTLFADSFKTIAFSPIVTSVKALSPVVPPSPKVKASSHKKIKAHKKLSKKERLRLARKKKIKKHARASHKKKRHRSSDD